MKGFTLIELIIVMAIAGILFALLAPVMVASHREQEMIQAPPFNGCIDGYKFVTPDLQLVDEWGRGILCD